MGLFRKKKNDDSQLEALLIEIESMRQRLDGADRANSDLEARMSSLDRASSDFQQRLEKVDDLSVHVQELAEKSEEAAGRPLLVSTPTPPPPPPPTQADIAPVDESRLNDLAQQLEELSATVASQFTQSPAGREQMDAVDDLNERFGEIAERVSTIDTRVTNVSFELANQLTELSRDIETISDQHGATVEHPTVASSDAIDSQIDDRIGDQLDSALDGVRESTEKLAAEQARYEIQFRQDLADLADRLRRPDNT